MNNETIGQVMMSSPGCITVMIEGHEIFEKYKDVLQVGRHLKVQEGNHQHVIVQIQNIKAVREGQEIALSFYLETRPLGMLDDNSIFVRGSIALPVPTEPVLLLSEQEIATIYSGDFDFPLGSLLHNPGINYRLNGNKLFSKHMAIVGSTGSGKSCAVAKILQNALGINHDGSNSNRGQQKNAHVVIFDIHSEYANAFRLAKTEEFNLNELHVDNIVLPYWLMNADELESLFIESNEQNSHNQISIFKQAVIANKHKHNPGMSFITYDTPVYFDIRQVLNYIINLNNEMLARTQDDYGKPKLADGTIIDRRDYFEQIFVFAEQSQARETKTGNGPFRGEFERFIMRLETRLNDSRLRFLLDPSKEDGTPYVTEDFGYIMKQFLGYLDKANVSIIDLSGIPFEVLSITVSLVARLVFDFCFHYSKFKHMGNEKNDIPIMLVCEEAHNYVPRSGGAEYKASKKSIERIAKEGRKYGISTMIVSQRPSEVSETIFAQCNNFVALRLNNDNDQNYIRRLLPESDASIANILPNLGVGEALVVGDASPLPSLVKIPKPNPEPQSETIDVYDEWKKPWVDPLFDEVIERWRKEK